MAQGPHASMNTSAQPHCTSRIVPRSPRGGGQVTVSGGRGSSPIHEGGPDGCAAHLAILPPLRASDAGQAAAATAAGNGCDGEVQGDGDRGGVIAALGLSYGLRRAGRAPAPRLCGLPKAAQALVASDVLLAFRVLPDVQTGYAVSAVNALQQAVEISLPKQKKAQAVSEFKHSVIAHKRCARVQQNSGSPHIPQDILVHIFSFLDMHSLVAAGLVCWSWNSASNDNNLWKMNYSLFFGLGHLNCNNIPKSCGQHSCDIAQNSMSSVPIEPNFSWKESFHNKYKECASWKFASNRALCGHCRSIIWLSNLTCASPHNCPKNGKDDAKCRPLLPDTVAKYILRVEDLAASSSESDDTDDSDYENGHPRFWTF